MINSKSIIRTMCMLACALFIQVFFAECSDQKQVYVDKFPREMELTGHVVEKMNRYPGVMSISAVGNGQGKQAVLVFDWNGNPVGKYIITAASYFTVDNAEKHLIAINEDDARGIVSRYDLPR